MTTVDRVGCMDYEQLSSEVYGLADDCILSSCDIGKAFDLLGLLKKHDEESAVGGLRTVPIALDIADEISDFYSIKIDRNRVLVTALLHDIGKLAVSKDLLEKSSLGLEWTEFDAMTMRQHVVSGGAIMRQSGFPEAVCRAVEEHHGKQLGSLTYGVNSFLDYEARIYRDATAIADYEEADINRTNTRNAHLNRSEREQEIAVDTGFVLDDYTQAESLTTQIIKRTLGHVVVPSQIQLAA